MTAEPIWIQAPGEIQEHQFSLFRKTFRLNEDSEVRIRLAADSDFVATLDGREILRGQFSDYPERKTYSECVQFLSAGEHTLLIDHYYCGTDLYTYIPGAPGIWAEIYTTGECWSSGVDWEAKINTAYLRDRLDFVTNQIGYTIGFDARLEDRVNGFFAAVPAKARNTPSPRPLPPLRDLPPVAGKLVRQGALARRSGVKGSYARVAACDRYDVSRNAKRDGSYFIYDLGDEYAGLIELETELPSGTIVDISHGEHLADGRVRNRIWVRNFTDRYIAAGGRARYILPRRIGGRFLQLNVILPVLRPIPPPRVSLRPREVELPPTAPIPATAADPFAQKLLRHAERTLRLCMHEHYEDTPWREQALYAYDSRNQMLFGYYLWGNYEFARVSLRLLGDGIRADGYLPLTAPTRLGPPIACFSLVWVAALYEHARFSGTKTAFEENREAVFRIVNRVLSGYDPALGVYRTPALAGIWHFYEWTPGLDGTEPGRELGAGSDLPKLEAPYNLHVLEMFDALSLLTGEAEWERRATELRRQIFTVFWDEERCALRTRHGDARLHELVQALGLYTGVLTGAARAEVVAGIVRDAYIPMSLSPLLYLFRALRGESPEADRYLEKRIHREFAPMLTAESTTLWETKLGEKDFCGAGSMCHGWSALPVYHYYGTGQ